MKVFVVMGTTGEYSDRNEWPVRAFLDEAEAQALVLAAETASREAVAASGSAYRAGPTPLDPRHQSDYTGTRYFVYDVELAGQSETVATIVAEEALRHTRRGIKLGGL